MFARSALFALLALCCAATVRAGYSGDGTAYSGAGQKDNTGKNACGFGGLDSKWERLYCALPQGQFNHADCGSCVKVCGGDGCVIAKVVDACAGCGHGDIDLSTDALKQASGFAWDRKRVSWSFVSCSDSGSDSGPSKHDRPARQDKPRRKKCGKKCRKAEQEQKHQKKSKKCKGKKCHKKESPCARKHGKCHH